jgi:tripartite-type tricarboxylate transporter receptor subunit TctC
MGSHRGIGAPAGLPDDVLAKLSEAVSSALENPEFQQKAEEQNVPLAYLGPDDFQAELVRLNENMQKLWEEQPWAESN